MLISVAKLLKYINNYCFFIDFDEVYIGSKIDSVAVIGNSYAEKPGRSKVRELVVLEVLESQDKSELREHINKCFM